MRFLFTALICLLAILQYRLWFGNGGLAEVHHLKQHHAQQITENEQLKERNDSLAAEVVDLKQGMEALEERARSEMGMIKSNETFYRVIENHNSKQTSSH